MATEKIEWEDGEHPVWEQAEFHGLTAKVEYEQYNVEAFSPRENDNVGHMLCWHPDYNLGDEQFRGPEDVGGARSMEDVCEWLIRERGAVILLPLFLYDHSGISISSGAPIRTESATSADVASKGRFMGDDAGWDTSTIGFIYATEEVLQKEYRAFGVDPWQLVEAEEKFPLGKVPAMKPLIVKVLESEVEEYDSFLRGEVFLFTVEDSEGDVLESVGGFLGDPKYAKEEAEASLHAEWARLRPVRESTERVGV